MQCDICYFKLIQGKLLTSIKNIPQNLSNIGNTFCGIVVTGLKITQNERLP